MHLLREGKGRSEAAHPPDDTAPAASKGFVLSLIFSKLMAWVTASFGRAEPGDAGDGGVRC